MGARRRARSGANRLRARFSTRRKGSKSFVIPLLSLTAFLYVVGRLLFTPQQWDPNDATDNDKTYIQRVHAIVVRSGADPGTSEPWTMKAQAIGQSTLVTLKKNIVPLIFVGIGLAAARHYGKSFNTTIGFGPVKLRTLG